MQASPEKQARRGILFGEKNITSKQKTLYNAHGKMVTPNSSYPKSFTIPILCLLIGGVFIKTDSPLIGSIIAGIGLCIWLFSGKKISDEPGKIQGPSSVFPPFNRSKSIPKGGIPEAGVPGWYWK